jgi:hypothetical protein
MAGGAASAASAGVTDAVAPGPVTGVTAVAGAGSATVSWTAPSGNGSTITGYTVPASPGGATCTWTSGPLSCTVTGLSDGTTYTFTVTSTNGVGTDTASGSSAATTVPESGAASAPSPDTGAYQGAGMPVLGLVLALLGLLLVVSLGTRRRRGIE